MVETRTSMEAMNTFEWMVFAWMGLGLLTFFYLLKQAAPYGRHNREGWGPQMPNRWAWVLMEAWVLVVLYGGLYLWGFPLEGPGLLMVVFFSLHYLHRSFVFPFRIKSKGKQMPVLIMLSAVLFNSANGGFLSYHFAHRQYATDWYLSAPFVVGGILFFVGAAINMWSDYKLIGLRKEGETGYKIPRGGLFEWMSCPNLFGEMVEWLGFALMVWDWAAWSFWVWTLANLVPRALAHHAWYQKTFEKYPKQRGALWPKFGK